MATSRTGTSRWKTLRLQALRTAQDQGITHCPTCHVELDYRHGRQPNSPEPDHILPHSRGGADSLDNLRIICRTCNIRKGNNTAPQPAAATTSTLVDW